MTLALTGPTTLMRCLERMQMTQTRSLTQTFAHNIARRFASDERGATAILFGIALVPVIGMGAAVLDYSRAAAARTQVQGALDATALMLARDAGQFSDAQLQSRGQVFFSAQMTRKYGAVVSPLSVTRDSKAIKVAATATVPTAMMGILGIQRVEIGTSSRVAWGGRKVELALVLDNTGSMADSISGQRKIDALIASATDLLTTLQGAARSPDDVKIAIVPFDAQVKVDPATYRNANWLKLKGPANWTDWQGYIGDRDQAGDYDVTDAAPIGGASATQYPAMYPITCNGNDKLVTMMPLTNNFAALKAKVTSMQPGACTNVTIGAVWGHAMLTPDSPMTDAVPFSNKSVDKIMLVLTDGDNTQSSHVSNTEPNAGPRIDARTRLACDSAKKTGIRVYTIRLLTGNSALLRDCASRPEMYFDVQSSGQLKAAFAKIASEITAIRLTQ